jgi:hypothetical protein
MPRIALPLVMSSMCFIDATLTYGLPHRRVSMGLYTLLLLGSSLFFLTAMRLADKHPDYRQLGAAEGVEGSMEAVDGDREEEDVEQLQSSLLGLPGTQEGNSSTGEERFVEGG